MKERKGRRFLRAVSGTALALAWGSFLVGQTPTPTPLPSAAPPAPSATSASALPKCGDCHTDLVAAFAKNPHARALGGKNGDVNDLCATCHGDGTKHVEGGGDASLIQKPQGLKGSEDCRACHQNAKGAHNSFDTGVHANTAAVNCLTCHSIHKAIPKSPFLLAQAPGTLCASCHTTESASFDNKPYAHRLNRGGMTCLDCHSPHATRGETTKLTVQGELPCLSCHADLRGPFVFQHVTGSGGDCLSCHQPHGSNNPNMLLWARVDQLCLSCHSQTPPPKTYGSQPPSFHDLTLPRYRNCTTCHVAVHGSNVSPQLLK
ncbi:MAG TPA: cytochrome c3 family protein [Thermoanaerobaculia bacterium]|nr:cytochrome c3 family protein [Thermoanaerobaculia bacterium]